MADDDDNVIELEQQLREKIASQKATTAELPSLKSIVDETGLTSPETKSRAQQIKELSDNEEQLELLLESKRVEAAVKLQDELHPPKDSGHCPICLETIKHLNCTTIIRFFCCGGWICIQCFEERKANLEKEGFDDMDMFSNKCPLCRERLYADGKETGAMLLEHFNKGMVWAQVQIGVWCMDAAEGKKFGLSLDKKKCWELIKQAADQGDPNALFFMSTYDDDEEMNSNTHEHYLKKAADLGFPLAQHNLALFYNMNNEKEKYLHYITLAASQGNVSSYGFLGTSFMHDNDECGLTQSFILAKHYFGEMSLEDDFYIYNFLIASYLLENQRYEGIMDIPGHSPIPTFLYWVRRAVKGNLSVETKDNAVKCLSMVEDQAKSHCANCRKEAGCSSFKRCMRCLGAWYCGEECQVQHWNSGHKIDCKYK